MVTAPRIAPVFGRRFLWTGYLVGLAVGGFYDGIAPAAEARGALVPTGCSAEVRT